MSGDSSRKGGAGAEVRRGSYRRLALAAAALVALTAAGCAQPRGRQDARAAEEPQQSRVTAGPARLLLEYYYSPGCRSCERFLSEELPALEAQLQIGLEVRRLSILEPEIHEGYMRLLRRLGEVDRAYPAMVVGDRLLQGDREIEAGLRGAVLELAAAARAGTAKQPGGGETQGRPAEPPADLALIPVIAAGLLDGVNPCAFTTLVFLLSALAVAGRSRRQVLILGCFYAASVFVTYFLIGLGFLSAVRYASSFLLVARLIRWALVAVLVVFASLSFYDYLLARRGQAGRMLLQLPGALKRQIHRSIRVRAGSAAMAASALALGFLVSVFELACTGQVYLPTIVYAVRAGRQLRGLGYLLLYNIGFIVPLLVLFGLSLAGLSLGRLGALFRKSLAAVKLALAGLFAVLALLTVLT